MLTLSPDIIAQEFVSHHRKTTHWLPIDTGSWRWPEINQGSGICLLTCKRYKVLSTARLQTLAIGQ